MSCGMLALMALQVWFIDLAICGASQLVNLRVDVHIVLGD